jgi:hypothetical protein
MQPFVFLILALLNLQRLVRLQLRFQLLKQLPQF